MKKRETGERDWWTDDLVVIGQKYRGKIGKKFGLTILYCIDDIDWGRASLVSRRRLEGRKTLFNRSTQPGL